MCSGYSNSSGSSSAHGDEPVYSSHGNKSGYSSHSHQSRNSSYSYKPRSYSHTACHRCESSTSKYDRCYSRNYITSIPNSGVKHDSGPTSSTNHDSGPTGHDSGSTAFCIRMPTKHKRNLPSKFLLLSNQMTRILTKTSPSIPT